KPSGDDISITTLIGSKHVSRSSIAVRLAGYWNACDSKSIDEWIKDKSRPTEFRVAACQALGLLPHNPETYGPFKHHVCDEDRQVAMEAIKQLFAHDMDSSQFGIIRFMQRANEAELQQLLPTLLSKKEGPQELRRYLNHDQITLPPDVAKIAIRIARSTGQVHQPLIDALTKAGKLSTAKWEATPAVMKELLNDIAKNGDPKRGELVYRQKELNCLKCHGIGGSGGQVGPDLTSIGASAQPDYLLESLLLPSKAIKENYNTTVVATVDGKVLTGIKQRENKDELVLRDAEGKDITIRTRDIDDRKDGKSLMPEGLVDGLTKQELVDLTRFLTELGKVGNYSVGTSRVARTWEVLVPNKASFDRAHRESVGGIVAKPAGLLWSSEYTMVNGVLPLESMAHTYSQKKGEWSGLDTQIAFARTKLEVGSPGDAVIVF
ncbi:MAG TPA: c-type cytochrome, partial [Gemmatales bacterium]|nr:c-type cytochrome [Gemmatales bacterium]